MIDSMKELANQLGLAFLNQPWLPHIALIVVAAVLVNFAAQFLLRRGQKLAEHTQTIWDDALIDAAARPLPIFIWLVSLAYAGHIVQKNTQSPLFDFVAPTRDLGVIVCLAWFLIRLTGHVSNNIVTLREARGEEVDRTTIDAMSKLARLTILIIGVLVALQTLGYSIGGVLAFGGIGGIAIGFAAKDILANFFGGLTIYLDRPFSVGDWIRSPDKDIEGTVEYISWRHTRVRAFNANPIYVPNALFTNIVVENPTRMTNRRIKTTIGIRYDDIDKMESIVAEVKTMLRNHPEIDTDKTLIVAFNEFSASSIDFMIYTFTKTRVWVEFHDIKQDILLKVADIIARHGAEIAFPTQTIHLENSAEAS
jgi:MscS family membrane protein